MKTYTGIFREVDCEEGCGPLYPEPLVYTIETDIPVVGLCDPYLISVFEEEASRIRSEECEFDSTLELIVAFEGDLTPVLDNRE